MTDSATRRELEASIRALVPERLNLSQKLSDVRQPPAVAAAGVLGGLTGYLWGRIRGRQARKRRER